MVPKTIDGSSGWAVAWRVAEQGSFWAAQPASPTAFSGATMREACREKPVATTARTGGREQSLLAPETLASEASQQDFGDGC